MRNPTPFAILLLLALAGCDRFGSGQAGATPENETAGSAAAANRQTSARAGPTDAGVTRSQSLAGLTGTSSDGGGKMPAAIEASASGPIRRELLIGRWSDDGNCKEGVEFLADGTFHTSNGVEGEWSLDGNSLALAGPGDTMRIELRAISADHLVITNADGSTDESTRC